MASAGRAGPELSTRVALGVVLLAVGVPSLQAPGRTTLGLVVYGSLAAAGAVVLLLTARAWLFPPK